MGEAPSVSTDPRHRNAFWNSESLADYLRDYADAVSAAMKSLNVEMLDRAISVISTAARTGGRVYSIGNGGSAAISDHLCCDFTKGTQSQCHPTLHAHSLNANMALYSAIANDFGFEEVFSKQVAFLGGGHDVLIAISSSGNSKNIIRAVEAAQALGMTTVGLSGFAGGQLAKTADISLYINSANYGVVEDCHQSIMHIIAQVVAQRRDGVISW